MEVKIDKTFQKDVQKIGGQKLTQKIAKTIINFRQANELKSIKNLKKIRASTNHYRIKIGDYRLGIIITGTVVEFIRCLHRKDIYRFFPKK
jgi:mRNA interferase RelE/StbE